MSDASGSGEAGRDERSGEPVARSRRARLRSAALWGAVAALTFLVLAQGYLLAGGSLPVRYFRLFGLGFGIGVVAAAVTYATEHRLTAKRRV